MINIAQHINSFSKVRIAVIGDLCLDLYYFLSTENGDISVETNLPTNAVSSYNIDAGGAGNVAINLKSLGALDVDVYSIVGNDLYGRELINILSSHDVNCTHIQTIESSWDTHVYHKMYKEGKELARHDIGNFNTCDDAIVSQLLNELELNLPSYQAVIINEQIAHGFQQETFQNKLIELIDEHQKSCFWISDCRHLNLVYNNSIRKLNINEAKQIFSKLNTNLAIEPPKEDLVLWLYNHWHQPVVVTLGAEGAIAVDNHGSLKRVYGINLIEQIDTVGAGDAFLAAFSLTLASGGDINTAIEIANLAATVSVKTLFGTGHPTKEEVIQENISPDFRYHPEIASDIREARYVDDTYIEVIDLKRTHIPTIAIFDHDGTISTLRQGWEPIMRAVAIEAIAGSYLSSLSLYTLNKITSSVEDLIEKTTGVQTLIQMHHIVDLVRFYGIVAENEIFSAAKYKEIYNNKLLKVVSERTSLLSRGLLSVEDLTIKDAVNVVKKLHNAGVILYLASGTDQKDLMEEASILGYAPYFTGGIFGSLGNIENDPKKVVLEKISDLLPKGVTPEDCYIFGDGPVEMREAAKRGFSRIGILSDEKVRFGSNMDKRNRLILGGAQALLPDFSWFNSLSNYMGWEF